MKITYVHIENFREIRSVELRNLTASTILVGPNGAGKSTILDALRICLAGQCYDQAGKRIPNEDLIGPHGNKAVIDLGVEIAGKAFSLFLTIKKSGASLTAKDARAYEAYPGADTATKIRSAMCEALGTDLARMECAVNPRAYLLGPELGNMLAELCAGAVDADQLRRAAGEHWDYIAQLAADAGLALDNSGLTKLGDAAYKRRTEVNKHLAVVQRTIAELESLEQPRDTKGNPLDADKIQPLTKLLNDLQAQRDQLISERGRVEAMGDPDAVKRRREALGTELRKLEDDLAAARESLNEVVKAHNENTDTARRATEHFAKVEKAWASATNRVNAARDALATLQGDDGKCPTCGRAYTAKLRDTLLGPLQSELDAAAAELAKINYDDARAKHAHYQEQAAQSAERLAEHRDRVRALESDATRIHRDIASLPDPNSLRSIAELNAEIATIEKRCTDGRSKLEALGKWADLQEALGAETALKEELAHLEWAIMAFRDGEFLKSELSGRKGEFEDACNAVLEPYGYALAVEVAGKHVQVKMARKGHRPAPIAQCSKGELVLAGWAVATAFAGESPICLDDMDALYGKTKNILLKSLSQRSGETPVIVAGAWTAPNVDLDPIRTALPAASVVWVEGGEARTQGVKVAA